MMTAIAITAGVLFGALYERYRPAPVWWAWFLPATVSGAAFYIVSKVV